MQEVCVYTSAFGDHDKPVDIPELAGVADVYCFTDDPTLPGKLPNARVFVMRRRFLDPRMDAKWYKMSALHLFPEHEWSVYLDSSIRLKKPVAFLEWMKKSIAMVDVSFFIHPEEQRSLEQEAAFSLTLPKYHGEPLRQQVEHYRSAGFSENSPNYQLYAGGVVVRDHHTDSVLENAAFEKAWFDECVRWTTQDQISLPYVLWQHQIAPAVIYENIYDNEYFSREWSGPNR